MESERRSTGTVGSEPPLDVNVRLFALARERVGRSEVTISLPEPATVADLRLALARAFPELAPIVPKAMIAVSAAYADDSEAIPPGSEVAVIPPVSGGTAPLLFIDGRPYDG